PGRVPEGLRRLEVTVSFRHQKPPRSSLLGGFGFACAWHGFRFARTRSGGGFSPPGGGGGGTPFLFWGRVPPAGGKRGFVPRARRAPPPPPRGGAPPRHYAAPALRHADLRSAPRGRYLYGTYGCWAPSLTYPLDASAFGAASLGSRGLPWHSITAS